MSRHRRIDVSTPPPPYEEVASHPERYQLRREQTRLFIISPEANNLYNTQTSLREDYPPRPVTVNGVAPPTDTSTLAAWEPVGNNLTSRYGLEVEDSTARNPTSLPTPDAPPPSSPGQSPDQELILTVNNNQEDADRLEMVAAREKAARKQAAKDRADRQQASRDQAARDQAARYQESARQQEERDRDGGEQAARERDEAKKHESIAERMKQLPFLKELLTSLAVQTAVMTLLTPIFTFVEKVDITDNMLIGFGTVTGLLVVIAALTRKAKEVGAERGKKLWFWVFLSIMMPAVFISLLAGYFHIHGLTGTFGISFILIVASLNTLHKRPEEFARTNKFLIPIASMIITCVIITVIIIYTIISEEEIEFLRGQMLVNFPNRTMIRLYGLPDVMPNPSVIEMKAEHNAVMREMILNYNFEEIRQYLRVQMLLWYLVPVGVGPLVIMLVFVIAHKMKYREFKHNQSTFMPNYVMECVLSWTLIPLLPFFPYLPKNPPS